MTEKYRDKYRISSARASWWDYGNNGAYFVTICTQNKEYYFGNIFDAKMRLSEIGLIANSCWEEIPRHFPFVKLDGFVVMPSHVHGIIIIDKQIDDRDDASMADNALIVETQDFASLQQHKQQQLTQRVQSPAMEKPKNKFGPQSQNLASIIRDFKIGVTKQARQINENFKWQARYHDHIIRNNESYKKISEYIQTNPMKWQYDKYYK